MESLARIDAENPVVIRALIEGVHHRNRYFSEGAIQSLGLIGPPAKAAVPDLAKMLEDGDPAVRADALKALQQIDPVAAEKVSRAHSIKSDKK